MPRETVEVKVSVIDLPHFRRLIEFVNAVEDYAEMVADEDLDDMVQAVKADLLEMHR